MMSKLLLGIAGRSYVEKVLHKGQEILAGLAKSRLIYAMCGARPRSSQHACEAQETERELSSELMWWSSYRVTICMYAPQVQRLC